MDWARIERRMSLWDAPTEGSLTRHRGSLTAAPSGQMAAPNVLVLGRATNLVTVFHDSQIDALDYCQGLDFGKSKRFVRLCKLDEKLHDLAAPFMGSSQA